MAVDTSKVRTVAVVGHATSGKTSLIDGVLFISKAVPTHGRVANGTSSADTLPDEIERKITIHAKPLHCQWQGHQVVLFDTPGLTLSPAARGISVSPGTPSGSSTVNTVTSPLAAVSRAS